MTHLTDLDLGLVVFATNSRKASMVFSLETGRSSERTSRNQARTSFVGDLAMLIRGYLSSEGFG